MADQQDISEARERVNALRAQIRAEQDDRAVATADAASDAKLAALSEEERHLEAQLAEVRSLQRPGMHPDEAVVPATPREGAVNVSGEPLRADQDPLAEGVPFTETVDAYGNLVRTPVNVDEDAMVQLTSQGEVAPVQPDEVVDAVPVDAPDADPLDVGTREADPPPPDVDENATMTSRKPRR
jgi:Membrane-bound metallopeptidase